ncbi:MAG: hypothetical protein D6765_14410 [Bacteroidetes bacterium]|nr:MAG: hypothetical protein D6765_14410 [Bacteroidota bacterium]
MKYLMLSAALLFFLTSCQNGCNSGPNAQSNTESVEQLPPPVNEEEARARRALTNNYWVVNFFHRIRDPQANRANQGRWYKFNPDGTYECGQFEKTFCKGKWRLFLEGNRARLDLDAEIPEEDGEWMMQMASTEDIMIWVGTERYGTNNVQMRLENLLFIPKNRQEMGLKN